MVWKKGYWQRVSKWAEKARKKEGKGKEMKDEKCFE